MISLIYVSSSIKLMSNEELLDILRVSHRNNKKYDITGMLLYKGGNFMQVLEGPDDQVDQLYEVIRKDSRHKDVSILSRDKIEERQFSGWEMAFQNLDNPALRNEPGYSKFLQDEFTSDIYRDNPKMAHIMLMTFKEGMR